MKNKQLVVAGYFAAVLLVFPALSLIRSFKLEPTYHYHLCSGQQGEGCLFQPYAALVAEADFPGRFFHLDHLGRLLSLHKIGFFSAKSYSV